MQYTLVIYFVLPQVLPDPLHLSKPPKTLLFYQGLSNYSVKAGLMERETMKDNGNNGGKTEERRQMGR